MTTDIFAFGKIRWVKDLNCFISESSDLDMAPGFFPEEIHIKSPKTGDCKMFQFTKFDYTDGDCGDIAGANYLNPETGIKALIIND